MAHASPGTRRKRSCLGGPCWLATSLIPLVLFVGEATAGASPEFPQVVEDNWDLTQFALSSAVGGGSKGCLLCHTDELDTVGKTVSRPVGKWFYDRGLRAGNTSRLVTLLALSKRTAEDTDDDGVSDYDELHEGTDPNIVNARPPPPAPSGADAGADAGRFETPAEPAPALPPLLETGCSVRRRTGGAAAPWPVVTAILFAAGLLVRGRRRRAAHPRRS